MTVTAKTEGELRVIAINSADEVGLITIDVRSEGWLRDELVRQIQGHAPRAEIANHGEHIRVFEGGHEQEPWVTVLVRRGGELSGAALSRVDLAATIVALGGEVPPGVEIRPIVRAARPEAPEPPAEPVPPATPIAKVARARRRRTKRAVVEPPPDTAPDRVEFITPSMLDSHRAWVADRSHAIGALNVVGARLMDQSQRQALMSHARFTDCDLRGRLEGSSFSNSILVRCRLDETVLSWTGFVGTTLQHCQLNDADIKNSTFTRAQVLGGDWSRVIAHESEWSGAIVEGANFTGADFYGAYLSGAVFRDCTFRDASLRSSAEFGDAANTVFERCDLRGVSWLGRGLDGAMFRDCLMGDARDQPRRLRNGAFQAHRVDVSSEGDGSQIVDTDGLLEYLRSLARVPSQPPSSGAAAKPAPSVLAKPWAVVMTGAERLAVADSADRLWATFPTPESARRLEAKMSEPARALGRIVRRWHRDEEHWELAPESDARYFTCVTWEFHDASIIYTEWETRQSWESAGTYEDAVGHYEAYLARDDFWRFQIVEIAIVEVVPGTVSS